MKHNLLIVVGPSGSGKSTLINYYFPKEYQLVSFTTRKPRNNEQDGIDYHFIDNKEYQKYHDDNGIIEDVIYQNNHYGYLSNELDKIDNHDCVAIMTIDGYQIMKSILGKDHVIPMFIKANEEDVFSRLDKRLSKSEDTLENVNKRKLQFENESNNLNFFIHENAIIHDNSDMSVSESRQLFKKEILACDKLKNLYSLMK